MIKLNVILETMFVMLKANTYHRQLLSKWRCHRNT